MAKRICNIANDFDFSDIFSDIEKFKDEVMVINCIEEYKERLKTITQEEMLKESPDYQWVANLVNAGYRDPLWIGPPTYNPSIHFKTDIVYFLDKLFGTYCTQCWINKTLPGSMSCPHFDMDEREEILSKYGTLKRYTIHIGEPDFGHIFVVEGTCMYMQPHGEVYEWDQNLSLHAGANIGLTPKYLLIYRGLVPHEPFDYQYVWDEINENNSVRLKLSNGDII